MNSEMHIILIEDNVREAETICEQLKETMQKINEWNLSSEMGLNEIKTHWINGSDIVCKRDKKYNHFRKEDEKKIENKIRELEKKGYKIGILMDAILTREEQERANINDFSKIEFSKSIMDKYEKSYGIYFITGIRNFGSRAWSIYGRDNMRERYVPKELVIDYHSRKSLAKALYWMYNIKSLPKELGDKIENLELENFDE